MEVESQSLLYKKEVQEYINVKLEGASGPHITQIADDAVEFLAGMNVTQKLNNYSPDQLRIFALMVKNI